MKCPQCQHEQPDGTVMCRMCGVIFAKLTGDGPATTALPTTPRALETVNPLKKEILGYVGTGFALALIAQFVWFARAGLGGLSTLIHETGHAATAWLFGHISWPAFDLRYGGGVAPAMNEKTAGILVLLYLAFAFGFWTFRRNLLTLALLGLVLALHVVLIVTDAHKVIWIGMGHGGELLFAVLFLYRALSNREVHHELERLAYALSGWFLVLHNMSLTWGLMFSAYERALYRQGKGNLLHDFHRIGQFHLGLSLSTVASIFFLFALLAPVASFLLFRYQRQVYCLIDRILER